MKPGILYGIGVGPGDPELITLKAVRALENVDVVFAASSTRNDYSVALSIAEKYLKNNARVEYFGFPMTRDQSVLEEAWRRNAERTAEVIKRGENAAFITIGDPLLYSTFGYILRMMQECFPDISCEIIPGITSYQAAAALTGTILAESGENLMVVSGITGGDDLRNQLTRSDNAVILKTYKQFDQILDVLSELDLENKAVLVSHCGQDGQRVEYDVGSRRGQNVPYLSLMIVKKKGMNS